MKVEECESQSEQVRSDGKAILLGSLQAEDEQEHYVQLSDLMIYTAIYVYIH